MNEVWSLDALYQGFETEKFQQDFEELKGKCAEFSKIVSEMENKTPQEAVSDYLRCLEEINLLGNHMVVYANLRQATNTGDYEARSWLGRLMALFSDLAGQDAAAKQYIAALPVLDALIGQAPLLEAYGFLLRNIKKNADYLLQPREEEIVAKMSLSGADAWNQLWETLTSTVEVPYGDGQETLSSIRNLAYDADPAVRKSAYEAELAAYEKIKDAGAFALNSIKLETLNECSLRGYETPLARSLRQAHMQQQTLDALLAAMETQMPVFRDYLKAKGKALGHENGLPWYDLFAPLGSAGKKYTAEEARDMLLLTFGGFDEEQRAMIDRAFRDGWIDFYPRPGKVGGAFCCEVYGAKQSRILANFGGEFGDIVTLAHELGHAFHNEMIFDHRVLNQDLPMPLAETASTFNENVLVSAALAAAKNPEEKLALMENQLSDACQIICDIYSRFLFEKSVFESRQGQFLSAADLCEKMLAAQKQAYGDGLDSGALHPYMWLCKGHYYSGGLSYYNFPYAFGGLLSRGLYAMYQEEGAAFVPKYKALLRATTVMEAEEAARVCGIDLTDRGFWEKGMASFAQEILEYQELLKK